MKNKLLNIAAMQLTSAIYNLPDDFQEIVQQRTKKTKAESKKCKSCKFFNECRKTRLMRPMDVACEKYVKRKK